MNGRCTTDPLDHADDVCEFCAGEFCSNCLITTRGGKSVVCRTCARANSGVKASHGARPRASKSEIKQARKELAASKTTRAPKTFQFFDEASDYVKPDLPAEREAPAAEMAEDKPTGKRRSLSLRRSASVAAQIDEVPTSPAAVPTAPESIAEPTDAPVDDAELAPTASPPRSPGRLADRLVGSIPAPGPVVSFDSPATAQLQHLRETGTPPAEPTWPAEAHHQPPVDLAFPIDPVDQQPFPAAGQSFSWADGSDHEAGGSDPLSNDPFALGDPFATADASPTSWVPAAESRPAPQPFEPGPQFEAPPRQPVQHIPATPHAEPVQHIPAPPTSNPCNTSRQPPTPNRQHRPRHRRSPDPSPTRHPTTGPTPRRTATSSPPTSRSPATSRPTETPTAIGFPRFFGAWLPMPDSGRPSSRDAVETSEPRGPPRQLQCRNWSRPGPVDASETGTPTCSSRALRYACAFGWRWPGSVAAVRSVRHPGKVS